MKPSETLDNAERREEKAPGSIREAIESILPPPDDMAEESDDQKKAKQRGMTIHQWYAAKYLAEHAGAGEEWIDENLLADDGVLYTRKNLGLEPAYPLPNDLHTRVALSRIQGIEKRPKRAKGLWDE